MIDNNDNIVEPSNPTDIDDIVWPTDHEIEEDTETDEIEVETEVDELETEEVESEESEEESSEETEEEAEETEPVELGELEIKVLGETKLLKDIPRDELQSIARKGTDYDRVREKLNTAQEDINEWKEISEMFPEYDIKETLKDQYFNKIAEDEGRKSEDVKREYNANRKSLNDKMYERFVDKYPDVKIDDLPQEVLDAVKGGQDLVNVYDKHASDEKSTAKDAEMNELKEQVEALQKQLGVKKQNKNTKKKGVVRKTSNDSSTENDDFLAGLTGNY